VVYSGIKKNAGKPAAPGRRERGAERRRLVRPPRYARALSCHTRHGERRVLWTQSFSSAVLIQ
jgi:hypothetical protein